MKLNKVVSTVLSVTLICGTLATTAKSQESKALEQMATQDLRSELTALSDRNRILEKDRINALITLSTIKKYNDSHGYRIYVNATNDLYNVELAVAAITTALSGITKASLHYAKGDLTHESGLHLLDLIDHDFEYQMAIEDGTMDYIRHSDSYDLKYLLRQLIKNRENLVTELKASTEVAAQKVLEKESQKINLLKKALAGSSDDMRSAMVQTLENDFETSIALAKKHGALAARQAKHAVGVERPDRFYAEEAVSDFLKARKAGNYILTGSAVVLSLIAFDLWNTSSSEKLYKELTQGKSPEQITKENFKKLDDDDKSLQASFDRMALINIELEKRK